MSIRAMNWAWLQSLTPTVKLLLMAMADIADDIGVCWPSIALLARKCCVSERTIQRLLAVLQSKKLIEMEPRYRADGSRTSNLYRLQIFTGDKLSPLHDEDGVAAGLEVSGGGDASDAQTTTDPSVTPHKPQPPCCCDSLIFPNLLSGNESDIARKHLSPLSHEKAQEVLDELAARLNAGAVKGPPLGYLRKLVKLQQSGGFVPEAGIRVAAARKRDEELKSQKEPVQTSPPTDPGVAREHIKELKKSLKGKK